MPSITFTGLQKIQTVKQNTYTDLHLDIDIPIKKDLSSDYDTAAIKNSIITLFNTIPGQNLLNPLYGLNLVQFLFEPINESNARRIGNTIVNGLNIYEPRVTVEKVDIEIDETEQTYYITLNIGIPALNTQIKIPGSVTKTGFILN